jgi:hypothetical protein
MEGDMSDCGCDYKKRTGTTYELKVEREGDVSDRSCRNKTRIETTHNLEV